MSSINPEAILRDYLKNTGNILPGATVDSLGRALLPLDRVAFNYPTDQGIPVVFSGRVVRVVNQGLVLICPSDFFINQFCITDELLVSPESCVRMPSCPITENLVNDYFSTSNRIKLTQVGPLSVNGKILLVSP